MAKRPLLLDWEMGKFFGVPVVRGLVNGRRITTRLLWWSHGHFGLSRSSAGTEETVRVGPAHPRAFEDLE